VTTWLPNTKIISKRDNDSFLIQANKDGLLSLGWQLISMAQNDVPIGVHVHYDDSNALEDGSVEFIIDKIE
jgi:hypothetical protein